MPTYWVIAPIRLKKPALYNKVWQVDLANNIISIGWSELGDISKMSRDALSEAVAATYPKKPPQTKSLYVNMLWAFYHEIDPGDIVIARRGQKTLAAIGKVIKSAEYVAGKSSLLGIPEVSHPNFLQVKWQEQPRDRVYPTLVFPMRAICNLSDCKLSEDQYRIILDECVESVTEMNGLPDEEADRNGSNDDYSPQEGDRRQMVERQIRERRGQQQFREALCKRYGNRCLVTGCEVLAVLEAAHINPYRGENDNHPENGLLLRADIHTLFDLNLIGIEPDRLRVELHPDLAKDEEYGKLAGTALGCESDGRPSKDALKRRYEEFQEREKGGGRTSLCRLSREKSPTPFPAQTIA